MVATAWLTVQLALVRALGAGGDVLADGVVNGPEPEDVKAGWTAFALFLLLALAIVILARSLIKQLRKAQRAADAGVYGEPGPGRAGDQAGDPSAEDPGAGEADNGGVGHSEDTGRS